MKKPRLVRGFFVAGGFVLGVKASSRASPLPQFDLRIHSNVWAGLSGRRIAAIAIYQAPPTTEACAVRSSCRFPLNSTRVATSPSTAAPMSQIPGAALLSSTWIR